jgi:hypothetical protein
MEGPGASLRSRSWRGGIARPSARPRHALTPRTITPAIRPGDSVYWYQELERAKISAADNVQTIPASSRAGSTNPSPASRIRRIRRCTPRRDLGPLIRSTIPVTAQGATAAKPSAAKPTAIPRLARECMASPRINPAATPNRAGDATAVASAQSNSGSVSS